MRWMDMLPKLARFSPSRITVGITERTARSRLKIKPPNPIVWNGIPLNCIGSKAWRMKIWEHRDLKVEPGSKCIGCKQKHYGTVAVCHRCLVLANVIDESSDTSSAEHFK